MQEEASLKAMPIQGRRGIADFFHPMFLFIGLRGFIGKAFLLYGLRTDFKRKEAYTASVAHREVSFCGREVNCPAFTALAYGRKGQFPFKIRA